MAAFASVAARANVVAPAARLVRPNTSGTQRAAVVGAKPALITRRGGGRSAAVMVRASVENRRAAVLELKDVMNRRAAVLNKLAAGNILLNARTSR